MPILHVAVSGKNDFEVTREGLPRFYAKLVEQHQEIPSRSLNHPVISKISLTEI